MSLLLRLKGVKRRGQVAAAATPVCRRQHTMLLWGLCLGLLVAGCGPSGDRQSASDAETREALRPVTLPALDALEESIRTQLRSQYAQVRSLENRRGAEAERAEAYGEMGQLLILYGFDEMAENALVNAGNLAPDDKRWPYYLGYLYQRTTQLEEAARAYARTLDLDPAYIPARVHLAEVYRDLERGPDAEAVLKEAVRLDPKSAAAHYLLGQLADDADAPSEAITHYETTLRLQPNASLVHGPLGLAYRRQGDLDRSRDQLARQGNGTITMDDPVLSAMERKQQGSDALTRQGSQLMGQRRFREALIVFKKALDEDADNLSAHLNMGAVFLEMGDMAAARQALEQALRLDSLNSKAHFNLGIIFDQQNDAAKAIAHYEAAVASDPANTKAQFGLSRRLWLQGDCRGAIPHFAAFLKDTPDHIEARIRQAMCHARLGEFAEARALLEAGLEAVPDHPGLQDALVRILTASADDTVRDGQRALGIAEPLATTLTRAETLESLAMAYAELGRFPEAIEVQHRVIMTAMQQDQMDWLTHLNDNLKRYEQGQPCRTPWAAIVFER